MKAAITSGRNDIRLEELPVPEPDGYRCLCEIAACASCTGTDLKIISGSLPFEVPYPSVLGHESAGRVIKTGPKARHVREGDIYLRPSAVYPGEMMGGFQSSWGGFAGYGLITDTESFGEDSPGGKLNPYTRYQQKIPPEAGISPGEATILITLKETSSFVSGIGIKPGSSVLVLGSGAVGKCMCFFSRRLGAGPVIVLGRRKAPLEWAAGAGCDSAINTSEEDMRSRIEAVTRGRGVDFCIDASGNPELVAEALETLAPGGRMAPYATYPLPAKQCFEKAGDGRFIFAGPSEDSAHESIVSMAANNELDLKSFYSHTLPFEKIREGFGLLKEKTAHKIIFTMES